MVENNALIQHDVFSYTRFATPWKYPGTWVQVIMFLLYDNGGIFLLNLGVTVVVLTTWYFVWHQMEGLTIVKALLLIIAASTVYFYYISRPFLITFLLFTLFILLFRKDEKGGFKYYWLIFPLMVIWVNSHGGFIAGFLVWLVYFASSLLKWIATVSKKEQSHDWLVKTREKLFSGVLLFLASLLNPLGFGLWQLFFSTITRQAEKNHIIEWQSPDFHTQVMLPFLVLIILSLLVMSFAKRVRLSDALLLCGFLAAGLISLRNIYFFSIAAAIVLSKHLSDRLLAINPPGGQTGFSDWESPPKRKQQILYSSLAVVVFGVMIAWGVMVSSVERTEARLKSMFPIEAVSFIRESELPPRMFNSYRFGGYLTWALPEYPVFIDGRMDLYQDEYFFQWYNTVEGKMGWQQTLEDWEIGFILIEPHYPLANLLPCYGWSEIYADDLAVIFIRDDQPSECK